MDNKEIRTENLKNLIQGFRTLKEFADFADMDASQVSQLKNRHGNIGDNIARKLEKKFKKPKGWMDVQHEGMIKDVDSPYVISDNENPITTESPDHSDELILRLLMIINEGIGTEKFKKYPEDKQKRIIRIMQKALLDEELSGLSDQSIIKMVDLNEGNNR